MQLPIFATSPGCQTARQYDLASHLLHTINQPEDDVQRIKKVGTQQSQGNNLMQFADMICGSVARAYHTEKAEEKDQGRFRRVIQARETQVILWPEGSGSEVVSGP